MIQYNVIESVELRAQWQIWILILSFNGWVNEYGQKAEVYGIQGTLPIQYY